jgi:DNA repair photolyase
MRWSGQQVLDDGVGAGLALPGLRGLLRTVRVPEFAGTTFHEVEAKSVLNRVPGDSPVPFRWTVNPYRGCGHACVYCLAGPTPVLLADGRTRPIAELRVGDAVLGTAPDQGGERRYVRTTVLAHWSTTKAAHRLTLADGTRVVASGEHRFLTDRGWRHVGPGWCRAGRRPRLRPGDVLRGTGTLPAPRPHTRSYRQGYLYGLVRADGAGAPVRDGRIDAAFPSARLELEALGRAHHFLASSQACAPALARPRLLAVGGSGADRPPRDADGRHVVLPPIDAVARRPRDPDDDWCAGFLAGVADAAATSTAGVLRLVTPDDELLGAAAGALHRFGFGFAVEMPSAGAVASARTPPSWGGGGTGADRARQVRLTGGVREFLRFLDVADPAVSRTRELAGAPVTTDAGLEVVDVRPLGADVPMFDITTGTGDFVAAGAVSHNCFARNTHTYLDLDAGADFDRQIVVKVNAARVLERELRAPRWRREPVAMGTNTDPYQRAEGRYRLMPGIVAALARSGTPFSILTKGTVLSRDLPLLRSAADDVPVGLGVSIALLDRALQPRLEPGTPSPTARLELVRRITDAGLPCGVMVAPVLPLLTDSTDALDALLARIAAAGATGASVLALHLRPGTREWFLAWLEREHPELVEPYARLYRRGAYVDPEYRRALAARVAPLLRRHGLTGAVTPLPEPGSGRRFPNKDALPDLVPAAPEPTPLHRRAFRPGPGEPRSDHEGPDRKGEVEQLSLL